jgi:antirestriction protein ArdC
LRLPCNLSTLKAYRGVNVFLLAMSGYDSPFWLTYRQAQKLGGNVRKGEKGSPVVFWKQWETEHATTGDAVKIPLLRHYTVFHVTQCDGIDRLVPRAEVVDNANPPIESCEAVVANMPRRPDIRHDFDAAFYRPAQDMVGMPPIGRFDTSAAYYATLFHELTHSTGHADRLNRDGITNPMQFGSEPYGREELIAEMGAAFLCAQCGIETATLDNSAAYDCRVTTPRDTPVRPSAVGHRPRYRRHAAKLVAVRPRTRGPQAGLGRAAAALLRLQANQDGGVQRGAGPCHGPSNWPTGAAANGTTAAQGDAAAQGHVIAGPGQQTAGPPRTSVKYQSFAELPCRTVANGQLTTRGKCQPRTLNQT